MYASSNYDGSSLFTNSECTLYKFDNNYDFDDYDNDEKDDDNDDNDEIGHCDDGLIQSGA